MSVGDVGMKLEKGIRFPLTGVPLDVPKMVTVNTIYICRVNVQRALCISGSFCSF